MAASVWRGRITFGLVSIPVRLVKAARHERTKFRRVQRVHAEEPDEPEASATPPRVLEFRSAPRNATPPPIHDHPPAEEAVVRVRNAPVSGMTDAPVRPTEILKGYETAKDEFVVLQPAEVAALRPRTSTELEISEFVRVEDIDPVYYDTSYYAVPEAGGEKAYSLLHATLRETGHAGIGSLAMHGREHVALIRAGRDALVLHTMFYANEVGRATYRVEAEGANAKELGLAKLLVGALEAQFEPEKWKDRYEEQLKALIESRTPVAAAGAPAPNEPAQVPAVDILDALRKSLERARKPVTSEERPGKPGRVAKPRK
jgi:DNA end-binding protein Ku